MTRSFGVLDRGNRRRRTGGEAEEVVVGTTVEDSAAVHRVPHDVKKLVRDAALSNNAARSEFCGVDDDVSSLSIVVLFAYWRRWGSHPRAWGRNHMRMRKKTGDEG
jgi:hypothetical protein